MVFPRWRATAPIDARRLVLGGLLCFAVCFAGFALVHMFPPAPYGLADDWRVFYAAAQAALHGGSPYDAVTIHAAEQTAQHYATVQPSLDDFTDLPIVAVFLRAVTWLPYWTSFAMFTVVGGSLAAVAVFTWLRATGWKHAGLWLVGMLCTWPVLLGFFSGQYDALLLAGLVTALLLMRRDRPWLAGVCMAVVLLKPHLLWPLPLLLFAIWLPERARAWKFAAAASATVGAGTLAGFVLVPGSMSFFAHLFDFGGRIGSVQPDLAGIPGLFVHLPFGQIIGDGVAVLGIAAVLALTALSVRHPRLRQLPDAQRAMVPLLGVAVWLACAPYAHPNDDVLVFPLLALAAGADGARLEARWLQLGVVASLALLSAFLLNPLLGALVLLGGATWLIVRRRELSAGRAASIALAAMVLLPAAWPFHVLSVSLTPVAVSLVALAGGLHVRAQLHGQTLGDATKPPAAVLEPARAMVPAAAEGR